MTVPNPHSDKHSEMREALRRDAARIQDAPFDPALHHAAMRRIRALSVKPETHFPLRWMAPLAASVALLAVATIYRHSSPSPSPARPDVARVVASSRNAIAQLSVDAGSPMPAWISPTSSLLDEPASLK